MRLDGLTRKTGMIRTGEKHVSQSSRYPRQKLTLMPRRPNYPRGILISKRSFWTQLFI